MPHFPTESIMKTPLCTEYDVGILGGGISGLATAYGLCTQHPSLKVAIFDAPTEVNKASRTNVGLIWCQSKFLHEPQYAAWAFHSAKLFPQLLHDLKDIGGIDVPVNCTGGIIPVLNEGEYQQRHDYIEKLRVALNGYPGHMLSRGQLEKKLPLLPFGPEVCGAAWCEKDGVVEPLLLMRAYKKALLALGAVFFENTLIYDIQPQSSSQHGEQPYAIHTEKGEFFAQRVVLATGLANKRFANFALQACAKALPIFADKGQVLLTERLPYVMPIPVLGCTQTFGGTVIIGFKHETRGHDATVNPYAVSQEGAWALRVWPELSKKRIIRSWPGLRIMPNDGVAIYSHLPSHPRATVLNTHSAVTLCAAHSAHLPKFILDGALPPMAQNMTLQRFGFAC